MKRRADPYAMPQMAKRDKPPRRQKIIEYRLESPIPPGCEDEVAFLLDTIGDEIDLSDLILRTRPINRSKPSKKEDLENVDPAKKSSHSNPARR